MPKLPRSLAACCAAAAFLALPAAAPAQEGAVTDPSVYRALGEAPGIAALVDDFVARNLADPRTAAPFAGINVRNLKKHLVEQFCQVSGGPCIYTGDGMRVVHQGYDITRAQFNAAVENLQLAMDARGVPFPAQRRFLAVLAPMHRDVVAPPAGR